MEPITGSLLSIKGIVVAIGLLIASVGGYAVVSDEAHGSDTNDGTNFLIQNSNSGSSFREDILTRSDGIENTVNNMLSGDVEIGKAKNAISYEKVFSKDQTAISSEDMKINHAYMNYLIAASDVVDAYTYESSDLQDKIDLMNEKKDLI
jgi:hypothetical protein